MNQDRGRTIRRAALFAVIGNAILAVSKLWVGISSNTLSVIGDGLDSSMDIITSSIPLFASRIINKEPNKEYPFGYGRVEATASILLSFVVFYAGLELGIQSLKKIFNPTPMLGFPEAAILVTVISIVGKIILAYVQVHQGRKVSSSMLLANGKNMLMDILISVSVLLGLLISIYTRNMYVDGWITLLISVIILKTALELFLENNKELIDGLEDMDVYKQISDLASEIDGVSMPHRIRARKVGIRLMVYLDIELPATMQVREAHAISKAVEDNIREKMEGIYDVMVHIEPLGNVEDETFGVSFEEEDT